MEDGVHVVVDGAEIGVDNVGVGVCSVACTACERVHRGGGVCTDGADISGVFC